MKLDSVGKVVFKIESGKGSELKQFSICVR